MYSRIHSKLHLNVDPNTRPYHQCCILFLRDAHTFVSKLSFAELVQVLSKHVVAVHTLTVWFLVLVFVYNGEKRFSLLRSDKLNPWFSSVQELTDLP